MSGKPVSRLQFASEEIDKVLGARSDQYKDKTLSGKPH
jgi:hypothetical protein